MGSDEIVTRLREWAWQTERYTTAKTAALTLTEAADEIERLRHRVDDLTRCLEDDQFEIERLRAANRALEIQLAQERQLSDDLEDSMVFARARLQDATSALSVAIQGHGAHRAG